MSNEPITTDVAVGVIPTDHWIVCAGVLILSPRLLSLAEAKEMARLLVNEGGRNISLQHVGA